MKKRSLFMAIALMMVLVFSFSACGSNSGSEQTKAESTQETTASQTAAEPTQQSLTTVKIAVLPYLDYTLFVAAKELGVDKEQGLSFELIPFALENAATQALLNGSIDVAQGALGSFVPLLPKTPNLRIILNNDQFKGFVYIGREGKIKTFDELMAENNKDFKKAQEATLKQFKGKQIMMVESSFSGMLKSALEQVGMRYEDVKVMNFKDDAQAATAFIRGAGDLYTGSLAQEMRLLSEPGYVAVAGNEVLGAAGLWYSNSAVTQEYLDKNPDVVDKLIAIHYKMTRYLSEQPDKVLKPMIDYLAKNASSDLTIEQGKQMIAQFTEFSTIDQTKQGVYNADSALYWKKAGDLFVKQNEEMGNIPEDFVKLDEIVLQEKIFNDLMGKKELVDWMNAPISN